MKLGIGALGFGPRANIDLEKIKHAESLGFDCAWTAEAYGNDAVRHGGLGSGQYHHDEGRHVDHADAGAHSGDDRDDRDDARPTVRRSLYAWASGPSGPQVIEGWHGVPYGKPAASHPRIHPASSARFWPAKRRSSSMPGNIIKLPFTGEGSTGLGKPLKSILHGNPDLPDLHRLDQPSGAALRRRGRRRRLSAVDGSGSSSTP